MTTSNNTSWELTRNDVITQAYSKIGIPGEDNGLTTTQITDGASRLNAIIALAVTDGMPLWKRTTLSVSPSTTSQIYPVDAAVKVAEVFLRDVGGVRYALQEKSLYDFNKLPLNSVGIPVHYTVQPTLVGTSVSVWPPKSDSATVSTKTIEIVYQKEFDGVFSATDTLDFPPYWSMALIYSLAVSLAPEYGVPLQDRQLLKAEAAEYWKKASDYGDETGSFYIQPNRR